MLKHSPGRVEQSLTVHGVKAGHVVHAGLCDGIPRPRSEHVSADDSDLSPSACGIALEDAAPGATLSFSWIVADDGVTIENPAWRWRPGSIFLGLGGALTQHERRSGWSTRIGVATSPTGLRCGRDEIDMDDPERKEACGPWTAAAVDHPHF